MGDERKSSMRNGEWQNITARTNLGDDYEVYGKLNGNLLEVVYFAFNGLKRIVLSGVSGVPYDDNDCEEMILSVQESCGDDWEVAIKVENNGYYGIVVIDGCDIMSSVHHGFDNTKIDSVEEFLEDDLGDAIESDEGLYTVAMLLGIAE